MLKLLKSKLFLLFLMLVYFVGFCLFYYRYVPLVTPFQIILIPILFVVFVLTMTNVQWGILFFTFSFPLINNLPYFFGIAEPIPHAPAALVLFLAFFAGWLVHSIFSKSEISFEHPIFKPLILLSLLIFVSGIITFFRYANFYPFLSGGVYELITNVNGVTAGGAIMSIIFFSLNYLTGFAFFFILLNTVKSKEFVKKIGIVLCLSTLICLCFGLVQHFKYAQLGNNPISIRQGLINATFKDALSFGVYIAIVTPLILGILFYSKKAARIFPFIVLILSLYMIFFTGSKSGLLCLVISLIVFMALGIKIGFDLIRAKSISLKKLAFSFSIAIILIGAIIFGFTIFKKEIETSRTFSRFKYTITRKNFSVMLRGRADTLWKMALPMIKNYPLTGVGIGSYIIEVSNYSKINQVPLESESAENYFLQVGSELGLVGFILILWIFWEILKQTRRSYLKIPYNDKNKFILIGAIAGMISFLVNIQFHTYIGSYEIKYTFWLLVALIFCLGNGEGGAKELENRPEKKSVEEVKLRFSKNFKIFGVILIAVFGGIHLWNSTHSLSLKSRTEQFGLKQDFGFYQLEKTKEGREFRWTRGYGGMTIEIEKPVIEILLLASHPDIEKKPLRVKIYLIKNFFKEKRLLDEVILIENSWKTYEYYIPREVNRQAILLFKVSRTWNPLKTFGTPDPRNLGIAVGEINFKTLNH